MTRPGRHSSQPKYQHVFEHLRREILSGQYQTGQKIPSEAHLEKRFGASRITIGRAVRDLCHQGLVERRAGSGTFVRPQPDTSRIKELSFGLLIPDLGQTDIFESICQGLAEAPAAQEHTLAWLKAPPNSAGMSLEEKAWFLCQQAIARQVSGVFFTPLETVSASSPEEPWATNTRIVQALEKVGIPVVLLDRDIVPFPGRSGFDRVGIDNWQAGLAATSHLLDQGGCQRPLFLASSRSAASSVEERIAGFRAAVTARGLGCERWQVQRLDLEDGSALRDMLRSHRPEAVVCANDRTAARLMQAALAEGLRVPGDLRIIGLDDVPYAGLLPVPLTTLRQPCREIGCTAMQTMLDRLANPAQPARQVLLSTTLVVRFSCGASQS